MSKRSQWYTVIFIAVCAFKFGVNGEWVWMLLCVVHALLNFTMLVGDAMVERVERREKA